MKIQTHVTARTSDADREAWSAERRRAPVKLFFACLVLTHFAPACMPTGPGDDDKLPPGVQDPTVIATPAGALGFYRTAVDSMAVPVNSLVAYTGILTDELAELPAAVGLFDAYTFLDSRQQLGRTSIADSYAELHKLRGQAREARGFVEAYVPDTATTVSKSSLLGHLYAIEGYADVWLADVFCSGIPLSTVDFGADYTLAPRSSTEQVYTAAAALFDSALGLTADSARLQQLAAVGKGRALLALGQFAAAAAAVATVPTDFRYETVYGGHDIPSRLAAIAGNGVMGDIAPSMGDGEGQNGLDYISSGDPRTADTVSAFNALGQEVHFPKKYPTTDPMPFVIADGIEARLIEAEAALQAGGDEWLAKLNALRQTVGLADTTDPGAADARVDLLFRERAFWLYLTGHRQGDLRRLMRAPYSRPQNLVYPVGAYQGGTGTYGSEVVVPVPDDERQYNPRYAGCINFGA